MNLKRADNVNSFRKQNSTIKILIITVFRRGRGKGERGYRKVNVTQANRSILVPKGRFHFSLLYDRDGIH